MNRADKPANERVSIVGPRSIVNGDFATGEELVILGRLDGKHVSSPCISIGPKAEVRADIHAGKIRIEGIVRGNVYAEASVVVHKSAAVHGDIHCPQITIQEGALVNGALDQEWEPKAADIASVPRAARLRAAKTA